MDDFNAYQAWLGLADNVPRDHYALLSLPAFEHDTAKIRTAAEQAAAKVRSVRPGPRAALWSALLDEIQEAKSCLLDPARKANYDETHRQPVSSSLNADPPQVEAADLEALPMAYPVGHSPAPTNAKSLLDSNSIDPMAPLPILTSDSVPVSQPQPVTFQFNAPVAVYVPHKKRGVDFVLALGGFALALSAGIAAFLLYIRFNTSPDAHAPPTITVAIEEPAPAVHEKRRDTVDSGKQAQPIPPSVVVAPARPDASPPAPPAPSPITRAEVAALIEALNAAKAALSERNFSEVASQLALAEPLARLPKHQAALVRLKQIADYVQRFQRAIAAAIDGLEAGESFTVGTSTQVAFVSASPGEVTLHIGGMNRKYATNDLPVGLAMALADLKLTQGDPRTLVVKGAFLLTHPRVDNDLRSKAAIWWQEAQASGFKSGRLLPFITDEYGDFLADLPTETKSGEEDK